MEYLKYISNDLNIFKGMLFILCSILLSGSLAKLFNQWWIQVLISLIVFLGITYYDYKRTNNKSTKE